MPTRRQERVAKRIIQELVEAFRELKNVDLGFVTVTRCEVSPDLRHAKVFVSVWGDDETCNATLETLRRNASKLKGMIGRPLGTRVVPSLDFQFDKSIANAAEMSRLIRDARSTDSNPEPLTPEEAAALMTAGTAAGAGRKGRFPGEEEKPEEGDVFDAARLDVEEELFGDEEDKADDPAWQPINLDELPEE